VPFGFKRGFKENQLTGAINWHKKMELESSPSSPVHTNKMDVLKWSPEQVENWFRKSGHHKLWLKVKEENISGSDLVVLTRDDWKDLLNAGGGGGDTDNSKYSVVELRRMLCKVEALKQEASSSIAHFSNNVHQHQNMFAVTHTSPQSSAMIVAAPASATTAGNVSVTDHSEGAGSIAVSEEDDGVGSPGSTIVGHHDSGGGKNGGVECPHCHQQKVKPKFQLRPERWKAVLAFLYVLLVSWITAFVMVIVHDRVPDMETYPPLPDILLDNIPHIPWAFEMCEVTGMTLLSLWLLVVLFHKHRFILMRRFFSISGTIFLLRCVTMLITSLSVPGKHLDCAPRPYGDIYNKLYNAFVIWTGAGMTLQGVRTCGDYMFSGHTVSLTLLNFFITEYSSRKLYMLHTFTWICNVFGVFFILAAHEHYSIDVFVAFYITSRLFMYYHTLANQQQTSPLADALADGVLPSLDSMSDEAQKTWLWFPLFSFFESNVQGGKIPNEFDWPITFNDCREGAAKLYSYLPSIPLPPPPTSATTAAAKQLIEDTPAAPKEPRGNSVAAAAANQSAVKQLVEESSAANGMRQRRFVDNHQNGGGGVKHRKRPKKK